MSDRLFIFDTTLRDGEQVPGCQLNTVEKIQVARALEQLGVDVIEAGFPVSSPGDFNSVVEISKAVTWPTICALTRAVERDIDVAAEALKFAKRGRIHTGIGTSDPHIKYKFNSNREEILERAIAATKYAKKYVEDVEFYCEDAGRTENEYLARVVEAVIKAGATVVNIPDTTGYCLPDEYGAKIKYLMEHVDGIEKAIISTHCHNDLGMATACSIMGAKAAIDAGVDAYINTAINGMGERAGNADLVSCLLAILKSAGFKNEYHVDPNIDLSKIWKLAKYTAYAFGVPIPINQPAVGDNAFAHESGIHADGALKDRRNYELYDFEELGRGEPEIIETGRMITTGEYGGIKGFRNVYDNLELEFKDEHEARNILELARYANVHTQKPLTTSELRFIYYYPDIAAKIMTVSPYYEPQGAIKERVDAHLLTKPHRIL